MTSVNFKKFSNKFYTKNKENRAYVNFTNLETLWFNTGTLCNLECKNCYIESSPRNDNLLYLNLNDINKYLDEIKINNIHCNSIGITGGEPFMNKDIIKIIQTCLKQNYEVLILTNAMQPLQNRKELILTLKKYNNLKFRISLDHYTQKIHEKIRGKNTWEKAIIGILWLYENNFKISIASRIFLKNEQKVRNGFNDLFNKLNLNINANNPNELVLFPEMNTNITTAEITTDCWKILNVNPMHLMCSNSRMIIKRKEDHKTHVVSCTLLPYIKEFDYGEKLIDTNVKTYLNHPHCSRFCVLGGANCKTN